MRGGPSIRHLDDVPSHVVARFALANGAIAEIREKWVEMSPRYVVFHNVWDPGALSPPHGHTGDHAVFILRGEIRCGDVVCRAGSHIMLEWGDTFGPWEAGPDGCELYGFIAGDGRPFADAERWQKFLAERGARELSVPPPPMPPWFGGVSPLINPVEGER